MEPDVELPASRISRVAHLDTGAPEDCAIEASRHNLLCASNIPAPDSSVKITRCKRTISCDPVFRWIVEKDFTPATQRLGQLRRSLTDFHDLIRRLRPLQNGAPPPALCEHTD